MPTYHTIAETFIPLRHWKDALGDMTERALILTTDCAAAALADAKTHWTIKGYYVRDVRISTIEAA